METIKLRPKTKPINRILCTADVHIYLYYVFSVLDERGFPSRLTDFLSLADDIAAVAVDKKADAIAIVGDLLHSPTNPPAVLYVAKRFIKILADSGLHVILLPGNHDNDVKVETNDEGHSIITPLLTEHSNITYVPDRALIDLGGKTLFVKSWTRGQHLEEGEFPDADVFFGHDLVKNTTDPYGHRFTHGFNSELLLSKYQISVVGDIHKWHKIDGRDKRFVLIPGQPLQTNFSSGGDNRLWIIDLKKSTADSVHIDNYPSGHPYHRFVAGDPPTDAEGAFVAVPAHYHYRSPPKKREAQDDPTEARVEVSTVDILAETRAQFDDWQHWTTIEQCFDRIRGVQASTIPEAVITRVKGSDFLSIDSLDMDLTEVGPTVLIHGENGSGKTTLMELIYWTLTGRVTKPMSADDVSCNVTGRKAVGCLWMTVNGVEYRIERTRGKQILSFWCGEKDLTKARAPDTQALIYATIGLDADDILTLVYFSLNGLTTFSNLGPTQKYEFLGRIANYDRLTAFRETLSERQDELDRELQRAIGKQSGLDSQLEALQRQIDNWSEQQDDADRPDVSQLAEEIEQLRAQIDTKAEDELEQVRGKISDLDVSLERDSGRMRRLTNDINATRDKINSLKDAKCPECGQAVHDDTLLSKYKNALVDMASELRDLTAAIRSNTDVLTSLKNRREDLRDVADANDRIRDRVSALQTRIRDASREQKDEVPLSAIEKQYEQVVELRDAVKIEVDRFASQVAELKRAVKVTAKNGVVATKLSESVCVALERKVNSLVADAQACSIRVVPSKDIDVTVSYRGNRSVSLTAASGGERRLVDALILIALNSLYSDHYNLPRGILGLSCYDEVLANLDALNTELCVGAVEAATSGLKLVISHDSKVQAFFPNRIAVTKVDGLSRYEFAD